MVSPEAFVRAWASSTTVEEVCAKTGLLRKAACARARRYRELGVELDNLVGDRSNRGRMPTVHANLLNMIVRKVKNGKKD